MFDQLMHISQPSSSKLPLGETAQSLPAYDSIPESDIADHYYDNLLAHEQETLSFDLPDAPPPRPDSRLDFNPAEKREEEVEEPHMSILGPRPLRFEWTKSLFQKIGIRRSSHEKSANTNLPSPETEPSPSSSRTAHLHTSRSPPHSSLQPPPEHDILFDDVTFAFCFSDEDDETDDETSDEESELDLDNLSLSDFDLQESDGQVPSSVVGMAVERSLSTPTSPDTSLPTEALDDSSMVPSLSDEPHPVKPRFSYQPSPLSPKSFSGSRSQTTSPQPQRHNYQHRGHSRHALRHLKWFWATREEEWAQYENATRAYGGISTSPELPSSSYVSQFSGLFASARTTKPNHRRSASAPCSPVPSMPPMTVHPRWGDLSGLRDPWCVHMDRYFVEVPMWRIRKSLWTADLHVLSMVHQRLREDAEDSASSTDDEDEDTESLMQMSMLTGLSDDSDLTLVDSDCEGDVVTASPNSNESESASGKQKEKTLDQDGNEAEQEYYEDIDLDEPSTSSYGGPSASSSSSSCRYTLSSSKSSLTSCFDTPSVLPSQPALSFHPPYAPPSPSAPFAGKLEHSWATNWYQRSQLLLQLLTREQESRDNSFSGLTFEADTEIKGQRSTSTVEDVTNASSSFDSQMQSSLRAVSV
ncbi:hypothetical protein AAF712_006395 [Marasmius tenuissimus]|uniref:Uncharacterized protein n=1 Tax=Marasmius tenuissimus TaxID=585030 RepID=A0ABR2ZXZ1_9AGAR